MTLEQAGIIVGIVCGLAGLGHSFLLQRSRVDRMEVKVDTLWEFLMRRAGAEAVQKGLATLNSPLKILPHAMKLFKPIETELRTIYETFKQPVTDSDLMFEIERQLGSRIVKDVCIPNGFTLGECLVAAAAVAKQDDTINLPPDMAK